jgi:hypothetical protein
MSSADGGTRVSAPGFDSSPRSSVFMRVSRWLPIVFLLASAGPLRADGGSVRARQTIGPYSVTVFTAPPPLRVGLADISVFIQHAQSNAAVLDAAVAVKLQAADEPARTLQSAATRAAAVNKLLYAAEIDLPAPGRWRGTVTIRAGGHEYGVPFEVDAASALPPAVAFWPYLVAPFVAAATYALHQWLTRRSTRRDAGRPPSP